MASVTQRAALDVASTPRLVLRFVALAALVRAALWTTGLAVTGYPARPLEAALLVWDRWDAPHYLDIARYGYTSHGPSALWIAFFPLYPFLVRLVAGVIGNFVLSGLAVSFAASVAAATLLAKLVELDGTPAEGARAGAVLFFFPTAYFLAAPYSESVFLLAVLAAIYAARTERWTWAGIFGAMATASRLVGLAVLPALAYEALWPPSLKRLRRLPPLAVSITGLLTYLAINLRTFGDPFYFLKVERGRPWFQHAVPPWAPVWVALKQIVHPTAWGSWFWMVYPARLAGFALAAGLLVWGRRRLRGADQTFAWTALTMSMLESRLISLPRYLLGLYPLSMVVAYKVRRREIFALVLAGAFALQLYFFSRYAMATWAF